MHKPLDTHVLYNPSADDFDQVTFNQINEYYNIIDSLAAEFLKDKTGLQVSADNKQGTYVNAPDYYSETMKFHRDPWVQSFQSLIMAKTHDRNSVVDAGCAFGITGLCFALEGRTVTFHDFEGLGLEFLRFVKANSKLDIEIIPYGQPIRRHSMVCLIDVLEHVDNPMSLLKWSRELGDIVCLSYPCRVAWYPPYEESKYLDNYVDDEAVMRIISWRWQLHYTCNYYDWRAAIFC